VTDVVALDAGRALGPSEARRLTDQVKRDVQELWTKLVRLYEGEAHTALGYASWAAYMAAEFGMGQSQAYRLLDAGRVVAVIDGHSPNGGTDDLNERQAREFVPLLKDEQAIVEVWRELREEYGDDLTAVNIKNTVEGRVLRAQRATALREAERERREAFALLRGQGATSGELLSESRRRNRIAELRERISECEDAIERGRKAVENKAKFEAELRDLERIAGGPA
jgi:hypothetical protein